MRTNKNKGFSLVELIVVILIMAIIAVSLAPQVMKWVDKSRQARDASNYDALYAAAQIAVTEYSPSETVTITMTSTGTDTSIAVGGDASVKTKFDTAMSHTFPEWKEVKVKSVNHSGDFTITVLNTAVVKLTAQPDDELLDD